MLTQSTKLVPRRGQALQKQRAEALRAGDIVEACSGARAGGAQTEPVGIGADVDVGEVAVRLIGLIGGSFSRSSTPRALHADNEQELMRAVMRSAASRSRPAWRCAEAHVW